MSAEEVSGLGLDQPEEGSFVVEWKKPQPKSKDWKCGACGGIGSEPVCASCGHAWGDASVTSRALPNGLVLTHEAQDVEA